MKKSFILILTIMSISIYSCNQAEKGQSKEQEGEFQFLTEQVADVKIMRYQIPGFEDLSQELVADADLLFVGAFTRSAQTAYAISNLYRSRAITGSVTQAV